MKLRAPYTGGSALGAHRFSVKKSRPAVRKTSDDFLEIVHAIRPRITRIAAPPRSVAPRKNRSPTCLRVRRSATLRLIGSLWARRRDHPPILAMLAIAFARRSAGSG